MVKANAYGHGDVTVASALVAEGVKHLGVALVEEGLHLRQAGIGAEILVFTRLTEQCGRRRDRSRIDCRFSARWMTFSSLPAWRAINRIFFTSSATRACTEWVSISRMFRSYGRF